MSQNRSYEKPLDSVRRRHEEEYFHKQDYESLKKLKQHLKDTPKTSLNPPLKKSE